MLVLSRKHGEKIFIGDGDNIIIITVLTIRTNCVRLGIAAPPHCKISRSEEPREGRQVTEEQKK